MPAVSAPTPAINIRKTDWSHFEQNIEKAMHDIRAFAKQHPGSPEAQVKSLAGADGSAVATVKEHHKLTDDEIRTAVSKYLNKHDIHLEISVYEMPSPARAKKEAAVASAWFALDQIQHRAAADVRPDDDIVALELKTGSHVEVALKRGARYDDAQYGAVVQRELAKQGMKDAKLTFVEE